MKLIIKGVFCQLRNRSSWEISFCIINVSEDMIQINGKLDIKTPKCSQTYTLYIIVTIMEIFRFVMPLK